MFLDVRNPNWTIQDHAKSVIVLHPCHQNQISPFCQTNEKRRSEAACVHQEGITTLHPLTRDLVLAMNRKNGFLFRTNEIVSAWKQCFVKSSYHDGIKTICAWNPNTKMRKDLVPA